jgi:GTP-binding protein EngB required for normal cell division
LPAGQHVRESVGATLPALPVRLADLIGRWIGKVEIVLAGADEDLREGEQALAIGDAMRARAAAHRVLVRAPESPIGLALLADACEAAQLDAELALTLEELARRVPSHGEVWVRLARARRATEAPADDVRDALVRALAVAESGSESRQDALLELADLDLAQGDGTRAELWLERAALPDKSPAAAVRRAEARLLRGDAAGASRLLQTVETSATDGRAALARGRAFSMLGDGAAFLPLVRAMVLDTTGASETLSSALASVPCDAAMRSRIRSVVDAKGEQNLARWRAAFARAEGARDAARRALREAVEGGELAAARPLLDAAIDDRDADSLAYALTHLPLEDTDLLLADAHLMATAVSAAVAVGGGAAALDGVARIAHPRIVPWAKAIASDVAHAWLPSSGEPDTMSATSGRGQIPADWAKLLARLDGHARALGDLESVSAIADLAADRARPLRLAIVGEFNAGKSTFINALIGADVTPTGVLPTTATLHHLRWAPDPIARIAFLLGHEPPERIVPLDDLRATLGLLDAATIRKVELLMPLAFLVRVEILDTPGFNAPEPRHTQLARSAFEEADAAIWLLDATQAIKKSERAVLEDAKRAKLPVQILVNKADRLSASELARVMKSVDDALVEASIASWAPPLALSAKRALAGRLGDAKALEESGWAAAQAMLEERIVARHGELKERALRRRAAAVVTRLAAQASAEAERRRTEDEALALRAHAIGRAAATIERNADDVAAELARSLAPSAQAWGRDLALVFVGRDRESATRDTVLTRYRAERAVAAVAPALARALASLAPESSLGPSQLAPAARTLVRAAAEASDAPEPDALLTPLARAAVATLVERLFALSVAPAPKALAQGFVRELTAFTEALQ